MQAQLDLNDPLFFAFAAIGLEIRIQRLEARVQRATLGTARLRLRVEELQLLLAYVRFARAVQLTEDAS